MIIVLWLMGPLVMYWLLKFVRSLLTRPSFAGKTVWITGASSGIGEYLAYELSRLQARLIISARSLEQLERVRSQCAYPEHVQIVRLDMSDFPAIEAVTARVLGQLQAQNQQLDYLIENAGVSMRCLFQDYHFNNHLSMQDVNVHGPYRHMQCTLPHMLRNKKGHIVGITSISAKLCSSLRSSYSGSKNALVGIMDSLRSEVHPHGIKVSNIMPGYVSTSLSKNALVSREGQKLGFTDSNIESGMDPAEFARRAAKAIYCGQNQAQICSLGMQLMTQFAIMLRNICPDLAFWLLRRNHSSQVAAITRKAP